MTVLDPTTHPLCPSDLTFEESQHVYFRKENQAMLPCCSATTFIKCLSPEFDSQKHAYGSALRNSLFDDNGNPDVAAVLAQWEAKRDRAGNFGTLLHNCMESHLLHGSIDHYVDTFEGDLFSKFSSVTPEDRDSILAYLHANIKDLDKLLKPLCVPKEDHIKLTYYPEHRLTYKIREGFLSPFLSGTADLVILHPDRKTVSIGDYKTNENIFKKPYNDMFFNFQNDPFFLTDSNIDKYTVQLNLYASMIKSYGFEIGELFLIWMPSSLDAKPKRINLINFLSTEEYLEPFKINLREAYRHLLARYPAYNNH